MRFHRFGRKIPFSKRFKVTGEGVDDQELARFGGLDLHESDQDDD